MAEKEIVNFNELEFNIGLHWTTKFKRPYYTTTLK